MTSKKIILILSAFVFTILFAVFAYCIFLKQNHYKVLVEQEYPKIKHLETKSIEENLDTQPTEEWNTYYDERYKYSLDFPSGLNVSTIYETMVELSENLGGGFLTTNGGVSFSPTNLPLSVIAVGVFENNKFLSPDEWLENKNSKELNNTVKNEFVSKSVIEKKISIDGNEAIVTHQVSMLDGKIFEEFKNAKTTVLIKDNNLFTIYTVMEDSENEKVWNSFKFKK
ncbi:MAG: hypothetical protein ABIC82_06800 [bacterium]